ncbi:MAG: hypothetical protein WBG32_00875 [Nodosilinea sp.]
MKHSNERAAMDFELAINALPPSIIALRCITNDQKQLMATTLEHYQDIAADVAAYFSGSKSPFSRATPQGQMIGAETGYYISLYHLIFFGWELLESAASKDWETLGPILSIYQSTPFPQCPGDALKLAIALHFESAMQVALDDGTLSVKESRKGLRGNGSILPGTYGADVLDVAPVFDEWIELAIKKRLKGRSDLRPYLKDYQAKLKARNKMLNRLLVGVRGVRWRDGQMRLN